MARPKKTHRYLIINLNAFLQDYELAQLTFKKSSEWNHLKVNSFAVSEQHANIAFIAVKSAAYGSYWRELPGAHELVRHLI